MKFFCYFCVINYKNEKMKLFLSETSIYILERVRYVE